MSDILQELVFDMILIAKQLNNNNTVALKTLIAMFLVKTKTIMHQVYII